MAIEIDVKGLEELQRGLEEIEEQLTATSLNEWAAKIQEEARSRAPPEQREKITLRFVEIEEGFRASYGPLDSAPLIAESIKEALPEMPEITKAIFERVSNQIEESKRTS